MRSLTAALSIAVAAGPRARPQCLGFTEFQALFFMLLLSLVSPTFLNFVLELIATHRPRLTLC